MTRTGKLALRIAIGTVVAVAGSASVGSTVLVVSAPRADSPEIFLQQGHSSAGWRIVQNIRLTVDGCVSSSAAAARIPPRRATAANNAMSSSAPIRGANSTVEARSLLPPGSALTLSLRQPR